MHDGIPPGLSASQTVGTAGLFCMQLCKPYWSHGNTMQFASPLQGREEFVTRIRYFNFSNVLQINRNPEENELRSYMGWIICLLGTELIRDFCGFCATSGNILEGANCPGNIICTFQHVIQRAASCDDWHLQLSP